MLHQLKDIIKRVQDACSDKRGWHKWATRFCMGIDKTPETAGATLGQSNDLVKSLPEGRKKREAKLRSYAAAAAFFWGEAVDADGKLPPERLEKINSVIKEIEEGLEELEVLKAISKP